MTKTAIRVAGAHPSGAAYTMSLSGWEGVSPSNFWALGFMTETRTPGFSDTGDQLGVSIQVIQSYALSATRGVFGGLDDNDAPSAPTRGVLRHSFSGISFIDDNNYASATNARYWQISSTRTDGAVIWDNNGTALPNTCTYQALFNEWGDGGVTWSTNEYIVDSVGQGVGLGLPSGGSELINIMAVLGGSPVNSGILGQNRIFWAWLDSVTGRGFTFSTGYFNGTIATNLLAVSKNKLLNSRINPDGFRVQLEITSTNASTVYLEVTSTFNTTVNTVALSHFAFKNDSNQGSRVGAVKLTSNAANTVNSVQTNSVSPELVLTLTSQVKSYDTIQASNDPLQGCYSWGMWEKLSDHKSNAAIQGTTNVGSMNVSNYVSTAWMNYVSNYQLGTFFFGLSSTTAGSGGFQFVMQTNTPADHDGSILGYVAWGSKVSAPNHLMDASSSSIFLADNSDYDDNLLLAPTAPAGLYVGSTYCSTLSNGGFEAGSLTAAWQSDFGTPTVANTTGYNVPEGTHFLILSTTGVYADVYQDYTLPLSSNVQSGNLAVRLKYDQTDLISDLDQGRAALILINSAGELASTWAASVINDRDNTWEAISSDLCPIPPNTNKVRIFVHGTFFSGAAQLSQYFDDFRLCFFANSLWTQDVSPVNKDFATLDTQSWNVTTGTVLVRSNAPSNTGARRPIIKNFIYGSATAFYGLNQTVAISSTGIYSFIDAGSATFNYKYYMNHFQSSDQGLVGVRFWDANSTVVGSYSHVQSPFAGAGGQAEFGYSYAGSVTIPASTRYVTYDVWGNRVTGSNLDAYISGINGWISINSPLVVASAAPDFKVGSCYTAVLSNGGYEEGNLNGWLNTVGDTDVTTVNAGTGLVNAVEGNFFARGAASAGSAVWWQDFIIPASFGVASGNIEARYSFYHTDYATDADAGIAEIHVINSAGEVSAGWCSSALSGENETWAVTSLSRSVPVPPGSAKVRIGYSADKVAGTELSFYVDAGTLVFCANSWFRIDASPLNKDWNTLNTQSWSVTSGTLTVASQGTSTSGWRYGNIPAILYATTAIGLVEQVALIPNTSNLIAAFIDTGSAWFEYSYRMSSFEELDNGLVSVEFLNASSAVIGSYSHVSSPFPAPQYGQTYVGSVIMPANTRMVRYIGTLVRSSGTNNNGHITGINGQVVVGSPISTDAPSTGPGSAAAGGALFRSQPVTDNRDFPTPLTNVRAFPSD